MLIASSTSSVTASIGEIAGLVFSDIGPYLILIIGIILAFYILEKIIDTLWLNKTNATIEKVTKDT